MAFPTGWERRQSITIDNTKVAGSSSLTDLPVLVTLDHLDSTVVDAGSASALNGGGDLRFSSDSAGTSQLPCDVVEFITNATPGSRACTIWVKVPSVSTSVDTVIYIWYKKIGETQPAVTDTYGRNAVWSGYEAILHLDEAPNTTSGGYIDSTGNGHDATANTLQSAGALFGLTATAFGGSSSDYLTIPQSTDFDLTDEATVSVVCRYDGPGIGVMVSKRFAYTSTGVFFELTNTGPGGDCRMIGNTAVAVSGANNIDQLLTGKVSAGTNYTQRNSKAVVSAASPNSGTFVNNTTDICIGAVPGGAAPYEGDIAEVWIRKTYVSDDWGYTRFNNLDDPAAFATAGTPVTIGGGSSYGIMTSLLGVG